MTDIERRLSDSQLYGLHHELQVHISAAFKTLDNPLYKLNERLSGGSAFKSKVEKPLITHAALVGFGLAKRMEGLSDAQEGCFGGLFGAHIYGAFILDMIRRKSSSLGPKKTSDIIQFANQEEEQSLKKIIPRLRDVLVSEDPRFANDGEWERFFDIVNNGTRDLAILLFQDQLPLFDVRATIAHQAELLRTFRERNPSDESTP